MDIKKTRSSLRKTLIKDEEHTEIARPERRISFSGKLSVRLFCKEEKAQNWDKSFEVSDHTSGDSTQNSAGSIVGARSAGSVTGIYHDDANVDKEKSTLLHSFTKDNIDGSHERNSLHIEHSVDLTLLPHEINSTKRQQHSDSVMSITPLNGSENLTFLTDIEREELRTAKKSQQIFDKTVDFMIDLKRATEINSERGHHTNYTMFNMDESLDQENLKKTNHTNYIMSNMEESIDQQSLKDLNERRKSIRQVQAMDITYGKENLEPINLSGFCIEEPNISQDVMKDNREEVWMETNKTIQNVPPHKTIIFNDDIIIDSDPVTQQSQYPEGNRTQDKPKVIIRTIQAAVSTSSTRADLEQKRLQRYHQKHQDQELQNVQPTYNQLVTQQAQEKSSINQIFNCSARSSLSLDSTFHSPLIPSDCISGNCNKRKLNLRQLNDDIENGRIQIFPNGPKTPTTDRKTKQRGKNWYMNDETINKSEVDMEVSYMIKTNLKSSKETEVTSHEVKKMSYRYSQADEANLDKTHFLTKAQIGDDESRRTTYSPNMLDMEETVNDNEDDDLLEGFKIDMETQNINKYPTSRKSLFFENVDIETTCLDDPEMNKLQESSVPMNIETNPLLNRVNALTKEAYSDILDVTPESNTLHQSRYRRTIQFTPGRSMLEFEDLEQKCENVSDEKGKNSKHVSSPSEDIIESKINEQHEVPSRKRQSIYEAVDIVLDSSPTNTNMEPKTQTKHPEPFCKSRQSTYNAVPIVQEESITCEVVETDLRMNEGFPCESHNVVVPMDFDGETHGNCDVSKYRKSIYKPIDIDLDTTCAGNKDGEQSCAVLRRQTTYNSVPILPETLTFATRHPDLNSQYDDVVPMNTEGETHHKPNDQPQYRKSIYKPVDIDLETTCVGNKDVEQSAVLQRQTTYNSVSIVPDIVRKNIDFSNQSDVVPMESEGETQGNDNYVMRNNKYRKSIYKTVDIDLETTCVGNKDVDPNTVPESDGIAMDFEEDKQTEDKCNERRNYRKSTYKSIDIVLETPISSKHKEAGMPSGPKFVKESRKTRQTTYNCEPILIEQPSYVSAVDDQQKKSCYAVETDGMRISLQDGDVPVDRFPMKNDIPETQRICQESTNQIKPMELVNSPIVERNIMSRKERQTTYHSESIVPESPSSEVSQFEGNSKYVKFVKAKECESNMGQSNLHQTIYRPIDTDVEIPNNAGIENSEITSKSKQTNYNTVPIVSETLTFATRNLDLNSQSNDVVPMNTEGETHHKANTQPKYRKSIYKPVDIDLETTCVGNKDVEQNSMLPEALSHQRQATYNSVPTIPEASTITTKNSNINYQSNDIAMNFEEDKCNERRNYRKSTYKSIDIVLETPISSKHKEAGMPSGPKFVKESRKTRQTTYNCEPILVEQPSFVSAVDDQQKKSCYVYETDGMRISLQDGDVPVDRFPMQNDIPKTQRICQKSTNQIKPMELVNSPIVERNIMSRKERQTTCHSESIVPESPSSEVSQFEGNSKYVKFVKAKECESNMGQSNLHQTIYKPIDTDVEIPNNAGIENSEITSKSKQTNYNTVPIVSETLTFATRNLDFNSQSNDVVPMNTEGETHHKANTQPKYRKSIYKPVDIDLETTCVGNKDVEQNSMLPDALSHQRQATYNSVPTIPEASTITTKSSNINYQSNDIAMNFEEDKSNERRIYRKSTYKPIDIVLETPTNSKHKEANMPPDSMLVKESRKSRQTTYNCEPILIEQHSSFVSTIEDQQKKTSYAYETHDMRISLQDGDVPVQNGKPKTQREYLESIFKRNGPDLEKDASRSDNNKFNGQRKDRQSIYIPADIVLETTSSGENEAVKDNAKIPMKSSVKSRQTTYQSVPIDLDITEVANNKAEISLEAFDEPMDLEEYPSATVVNHNLVQQDKPNIKRKYRKSIYKPADIDIEDDDNVMTEVNAYHSKTICNSIRREELNSNSKIRNKTTTKSRRQICYAPLNTEQESKPENIKSQLLMKESHKKKELSDRNISVKEEEEGDATTYKYDFDRLAMEHKELLGSYECGKVPKSEKKNQSTTEHHLSSHNNIEQSSIKRLPIHLTPHLPSSKKRHTIFKNNKSMNRESLVEVGGDTTHNDNVAKYSELQNEYIDDTCLDNESILRVDYLTPARKKSYASRIPLLTSSKKSPPCRAPSILENSVQAPRYIQQQSRNTLELENVNNIDKSQKAANKPQGAVSIFEGNPITISDVSRHFEAEKRLTVASLPDSSEQSSANSSSIEHNNRYKSRDKGKQKSLMKFINWSSDTTLFAAGNDMPTVDLLENTRISLVETLINDGGSNNEEEELEFSPESKTDSITENLDDEEEQDRENDIKMQTQSLRSSNSMDPVDYAEDSFALPQLPYWPKKAMERLRQIRSKPHIADVHEYWRRHSMEQSCVIIDDSIEDTELKEEFCAANIIANYQKTRKMHRFNRQQQQQKKPAVRLPFVKRLDNLLHECSCPNWIFDYELEARNQYIFNHKKILTMSLILNFEELDILGHDINISSINYVFNRIPKKNWEPFDYLIDFQIQLKMSLMHREKTLLQECNENSIFKFLCNIDNILMDVRRTCDDVWNIVCMKQAQLLRNSNRTIIRKIIRTVVSKPNNEYSRVESKQFIIELANIEKLCFKDIILPKLYFFREDIQYLPTGLNFLREFLSNPMKYLKNKKV